MTKKIEPSPFFPCEIFYILSTGRTRTRWARTARAWTHRRWSFTGADSKTIKNSFDILALTFYTGYFTFFHLFNSCSNLKAFMAVLTFKIIVWHNNFSFLIILFLSTLLFYIYLYSKLSYLSRKKSIKPLQNLFKKPAKGPSPGRFLS